MGDHATNMPATVWFGGGNAIKDSIKYKYDSCGNISQITENGHLTAKYTYDSLNRLIREDNKTLNRTVLYTYDNNGNIVERCKYDYTSKTGEELTELECKHFSYDYDGDKLVSYNGEVCEYESNGRITKYRGKALEWQYGKRLIGYGNLTFVYDGAGRRIQKKYTTTPTEKQNRQTVFEPLNMYDDAGNLVREANGIEYIYDSNGVTGIIYENEKYFYRKDAQGNIIAILDNNGAVVVKYVYDAWGNHDVYGLNKVNGIEVLQDIYKKNAPAFAEEYLKYKQLGELNPFRYRGYYYDIETDLYFLQTRYYDPEVGRFINMDSIDYATPEIINGLNLYAYCGNNPIKYIDPNGNFFWIALGLAAIVVPLLFIESDASPTPEQIDEAKKEALEAEYIIREIDGGKVTVDINIDIENQRRISDKVIDYYYESLYNQSIYALTSNGYSLDNAILMDVGHIKWEYRIHILGYSLGGKVADHCKVANLNYEENFFTIIKRFIGI